MHKCIKSKSGRIILILFIWTVANQHLLYCTFLFWRMDVYCTFMTHIYYVVQCSFILILGCFIYRQYSPRLTNFVSMSTDTFHVLSTHIVTFSHCNRYLGPRPQYGNTAQPWFYICKTFLETRKQFLKMWNHHHINSMGWEGTCRQGNNYCAHSEGCMIRKLNNSFWCMSQESNFHWTE